MMATSSTGNKASDQINALGDLVKFANLFKSSGGGTTTQTTTNSVSQAAVDEQLKKILEGSRGIAQTAQGQKSTGLYGSSTNKMLINDLTAQAAASGAALNSSSTVATTAPKAPAAMGGKELVGMMLLNKIANSKAGQKAVDSVTGAVSTGVDSAIDWAGSLFSDSGAPADIAAYTEQGILSGLEAAGIGAAADVAADAGSGIWDSITGFFGFAEGGRVPQGTGAVYSKVFSDPVRTALGQYSRVVRDPSGGSVSGKGEEAGNENYTRGFEIQTPSKIALGSQILTGLGTSVLPTGVGPLLTLTGAKGAIQDKITEYATQDYFSLVGQEIAGGKMDFQQAIEALSPFAHTEHQNTISQMIADAIASGQLTAPEDTVQAPAPVTNALTGETSGGGDAGNENYGVDFGGDGFGTGTDLGGEPSDTAYAAKGGRIKGDRVYGKDDVPAMLDGGEVVINARSTQLIDRIFGPDFLNKLNNLDKLVA